MWIFGQKYGPINSIVLSRSAESDNVYIQDEESVQENGLCEVKIADNQIMNFNNRSDYLQGLLTALDGLYYYINDFNSTGILYYEVGDMYYVTIGENAYKCLMLNDEITVTTGIEERIYTDLPEQSQTDYSKADKTDRRINQTYLIVDKQNQQISSVISQTIDKDNPDSMSNKLSKVSQTVDELNSKISDIADITTYGESDRAYVELTDINQSEPIMIKVHPTSANISYLYPRENLYPSDTQYMPNRIVRFTRTYEEDGQTLTEDIDYELPDDLLRYSDTVYDEFYLDYDSQTCQIIKRCKYNADGSVYKLQNEITVDYPYPQILLGDGDYEISLPGYDFGYLYVRLMAKNIYTTQFYTKVETDSIIDQKANEINLGVNQTLTNYSTTNQMNSAITIKANEINSTVSQKVGKNEVISSINQSAEAVTINANKVNLAGKTINLTGDNIKIASTNFNVDKNGNVTANSLNSNNATITGGKINIKGDADAEDLLRVINSNNTRVFSYLQPAGAGFVGSSGRIDITPKGSASDHSYIYVEASGSSTTIREDGITTPRVTQTSLESKKKNFEKFETGIETLNDIDIYKYNFNNEDDKTKKHIGFVIGKKYKYSKDVTSENNDGVDLYSFVSVCCQAIKEQQEQIEQMKKEIEELKGGK